MKDDFSHSRMFEAFAMPHGPVSQTTAASVGTKYLFQTLHFLTVGRTHRVLALKILLEIYGQFRRLFYGTRKNRRKSCNHRGLIPNKNADCPLHVLLPHQSPYSLITRQPPLSRHVPVQMLQKYTEGRVLSRTRNLDSSLESIHSRQMSR